jgi:hypothetical protein
MDMKNSFFKAQVYPEAPGLPLAEIAAVDEQEQKLLGNDISVTSGAGKAKTYNIISAAVVLIVIMLILQFTS